MSLYHYWRNLSAKLLAISAACRRPTTSFYLKGSDRIERESSGRHAWPAALFCGAMTSRLTPYAIISAPSTFWQLAPGICSVFLNLSPRFLPSRWDRRSLRLQDCSLRTPVFPKVPKVRWIVDSFVLHDLTFSSTWVHTYTMPIYYMYMGQTTWWVIYFCRFLPQLFAVQSSLYWTAKHSAKWFGLDRWYEQRTWTEVFVVAIVNAGNFEQVADPSCDFQRAILDQGWRFSKANSSRSKQPGRKHSLLWRKGHWSDKCLLWTWTVTNTVSTGPPTRSPPICKQNNWNNLWSSDNFINC